MAFHYSLVGIVSTATTCLRSLSGGMLFGHEDKTVQQNKKSEPPTALHHGFVLNGSSLS